MRGLAFAARVLLAAGAVAGCLYSLLLGRAALLFQEDTAHSTRAAAALAPYNSEYLERLSAWIPEQKVDLLRRAVALNPFNSRAWITLGLAAEFQNHDAREAERCFLAAADADHMYLPKWTLTNFYFRQGRASDFFRWAKLTLEITPYSPEPVFSQMWLISQDAAKIAGAVPARTRTLLQYAWFLSHTGHAPELPGVVERLTQAAAGDAPAAWGRDDLIAAMEDHLAAEGEVGPALGIWTALARAKWIPQSVPDVMHPLTNGNFRLAFYPHAFDWAPVRSPGVQLEQLAAEGAVRIRFSGDEAEQAMLLRQYIPVRAGLRYVLRWAAAAEIGASTAGLRWRLTPIPESGGNEQVSPDLLESSARSWQFQTAPGSGEYRLALVYARPPGEVRARSAVRLTSVSLLAEP